MEQQITLNLSINHANIILGALAKQPLEVVYDVFTSVRDQCSAAIDKQDQ